MVYSTWNSVCGNGAKSSDAGLIPLALADQRLELTEKLAQAIDDPRDPRRIDHTMHDLLRERIYLIAQGYADANDANSLRHDPLLKLALGRAPSEPALAGQSTLCRLENGGGCNYQVQYIRDRRALPITRDYIAEAEARYRKIAAEPATAARKPRGAGRRKTLESTDA